jgi:hypothetical protein
VKEYLAPDGDASLDQLHELVGTEPPGVVGVRLLAVESRGPQ